MLHKNVKFYFKVISAIEAHSITRQIFSVFMENRICIFRYNVYALLHTQTVANELPSFKFSTPGSNL